MREGKIFLPVEETISSFLRPVIKTKPSLSM